MLKFMCLLIFVVYTFAKSPNPWSINLFSLPYKLKQIVNTIPASEGCVNQLKSVLHGIKSEKLWALEMLDATAKPMPGILTGNLQQFGNYDQCLSISAKINVSETIEGKYCMAIIIQENSRSAVNITTFQQFRHIKLSQFEKRASRFLFTLDFCIPSICSVNDLQLIVNGIAKLSKYKIQFSEDFCFYKSKRKDYTIVDYFAMAFLGIFFVLLGGCTLCDLYRRNQQILHSSTKYEILIRAFSLYSNMRSLLFSPPVDKALACINGIKAISMSWIVVAHHFLIALYMPAFYGVSKLEFLKDSKNFILFGSTLSVDTFFVISGCLVTYNFLKMHEKGMKITLIYFYLHRLLRLLPALAALILLYTSILRLVGDGPLWSLLWRKNIYESCLKNWWWNLLFIENYCKTNRCAHHGWYLSVDTQLYALSPLFLYPFLRHSRKVIVILFGFIAMSIISAFVISWENKLGVNFVHDHTDNLLYLPTHIRAPPYLLGSILGYFIFTSRTVSIKINKVLEKLLLSTSLFMLLYLPYLYFYISNLDKANVLQSALLNSLSRPVWSLSVCWIIYSCFKGYNKTINNFLSQPIFTVLSRITYSMYLTHVMVIQFIMYQNRGPLYFRNLYLYRNAIGDYFIACAFAVVWNLCFESPILVAEKILLTGKGIQKIRKGEKYLEAFNTKLMD